jgi:hypothetical protein
MKRGIGEMIGRISKAVESEKPSIVLEIDKACSAGITSAGAFSVTGIKRQLKVLLDAMEDFNREVFFTEFQKLYSLVMAPDLRAKNVFHPSSLLDDCPRMLYYDLSKTPITDPKVSTISGQLQRIFDSGTWNHVYVQNILYQLGLLEQAEVPVINEARYINGKADGIFKDGVFPERTVLEIKTTNSWNFKKVSFKPFKKHEFQASLYGRELSAKYILYLYINKDTSEMLEHWLPINEEQLEIADKKMNKIIKSVQTKEVPDRVCPDRFCERAMNCPFVSHCFKE